MLLELEDLTIKRYLTEYDMVVLVVYDDTSWLAKLMIGVINNCHKQINENEINKKKIVFGKCHYMNYSLTDDNNEYPKIIIYDKKKLVYKETFFTTTNNILAKINTF